MSDKEYTAEIQKLLIQGLVSDGTMFTRCQAILKPEYFDTQFKSTVKFILEYTEKYNTMPSTEQIEAYTNIKIEKLSEFNEQHQMSFLNEIESFCRHKALVLSILKSADLLEKGNHGGIEEIIREAMLVGLTKSLGTDYFEDPRARLLQLKEESGTLSSGWPQLDRKTYNFGRGETLLFLALSGGGKSVVLQNLAINFALQNMNVVYVTLELAEGVCAKRIDSMFCDIASYDIYKKLDDVELKVKSLKNRSGDITIKRLPAREVSTRDLKSYLKEYEIQKGFTPDIFILDYQDELNPNDSKISSSDLSTRDRCTSIELRNMAIEYDLLLITASQLGKQATTESEFDMSMVAGGKGKIDTTDNCVAIRSGITLRDRGEIEFEILKTRNGPGMGSKITLSFDVETLRIIDNNEDKNSQKPKNTKSALEAITNRTNVKKSEDEPDSVDIGTPDIVQHNNSLRDLINKNRNK